MRLYEVSDLYNYESLMHPAEQRVLQRLRKFLEAEVAPIVDDYWERGEFPSQLVEPIVALELLDPPELREAGLIPRPLFEGFRLFEIARTDASIATYFSGQATMIMSAVVHGAAPDQLDALISDVKDYTMKGVFAITEPDHGSDVAKGMETTAVFERGQWTLNGAKRWIGSAAYASHICVIAKEPQSGAVRAFLVPTESDGLTISSIQHKASLRMVDNADIRFDNVMVPEALRLGNVDTFSDVGRMLRHMRASVVWLAAGVQAGAYEAALAYVANRQQFGRPIAGYQLVQEKIARMLANITASLGFAVRLAQLQEVGVYRDEDSALAKYAVCADMRETVALAREVCGGNGIVLETGVMRFFCDAEAIYTYEGTNEISALVAGRAATGMGAFV